MSFFKSLFGTSSSKEEEQQKSNHKAFNILKYDGIRAKQMYRHEYAVRCFTEALKLNNDLETRTLLAQTLIELDENEEALEILKETAQQSPTHIPTLSMIANLSYIAEDYQTMADVSRTMIGIDAQHTSAYFLLARALRGTGMEEEAVSQLNTAIEQQPDYVDALLLRAQILLHLKRYELVGDDIEALLAHDAEEDAFLLRGQLAEQQGNADDAKSNYRHVLESNPFNQQAFTLLCRLLMQLGQDDEAMQMLNDEIELSPEFADAYLLRSQLRQAAGDNEGAEADRQRGTVLKQTSEAPVMTDAPQPEKNVLGL